MNDRENKKALNVLTEITRTPPKRIIDAGNAFLSAFTQYISKYSSAVIVEEEFVSKYRAAVIAQEELEEKIATKTSVFRKKIPFKSVPKSVPNVDPNFISEDEMFAFSEEIATVDEKLIVSNIPQIGDTIIAERKGIRKNVKLIEVISSGGEGITYRTDMPNLVAKIYKNGKNNKHKYEKINLMLTKKIFCKGVCFPIAAAYNKENEFIGYLMPEAKGKELQRCVFIPKLLTKEFPNWKKRDTVELCITILKKLKYLHDRNIILGDINPNNILVVSPKEVYFVDTDSFQIEGFPCPVGTTNFTAPEIQGRKYESFLRTMGHEQFAVATLLFMIMHPGKPPYSVQGGENQSKNIINMDFPYPLGDESAERAPDGPWRFCWSHLPFTLKEAFYQTFKEGEERSTEKNRYSSDDWLQMFKDYLELLENTAFSYNNEMSTELFPMAFKESAKGESI